MKKRIIICADGTWNTPDEEDGDDSSPTNVVKISHAILPQAPDNLLQIVFYDEGVGTDKGQRFFGGALGLGLSKNVIDAYRFLVNNYQDGDDLYFFGFSRGAYTVRSLAGLIRNCGILHKINASLISAAYRIYRSQDDDDSPDGMNAVRFRKQFSRDFRSPQAVQETSKQPQDDPLRRIKFIGIWDTVGSLGIPSKFFENFAGVIKDYEDYRFHDTRLSGIVENAYHALAIDERRIPFAPTLWEKRRQYDHQNLEQRWFVGGHSNIGGGYKEDSLSDITLLWMRSKAEDCDLAFDDRYFKKYANPNAINGHIVDEQGKQAQYQLLGFLDGRMDHQRPIAEPLPNPNYLTNEVIDESVIKRFKADNSYRPDALLRYFKQNKKYAHLLKRKGDREVGG